MTRKTITLTVLLLWCTHFLYAQAPTANFSGTPLSGCSPLVVSFTDASTGNPTSWLWDFGNGATSTIQNPSTTYFTPGTYTIRLTVTNASGTNTLTRTGLVTVYGKPSVRFGVDDSLACFPHPARFTDFSTPSTGTVNNTWLWDFGDGTQSTEQNPEHVFTNSGNYTVTLKVTNDKGCWAVGVKPDYIQIAGGVTAGFNNTQPGVCKPPFSVNFTNTSTGPGTMTYLWDFGDGTTSTNPNPTHTYTTVGNFSVSLRATSSDGCTDTVVKTSLFNLENFRTDFTAPERFCTNEEVSFVNTSVPEPVSTRWVFGDGTTDTARNPFKRFATAGTYTVRLYNNYGFCTDSAARPVTVLGRPAAAFTATNATRCQPDLTVSFSDQSTGAVSWQWIFGDSTTSTEQHPQHTYSDFGDYNVRLIVTNAAGCTDTLRRDGFVLIRKPVITIDGLPAEGCLPYRISLSPNIQTLDAVTSYLWDMGDGRTYTTRDIAHTYTTQGAHTIRLTITTSSGCTETLSVPNAVTVGRIPVVDFALQPPVACALQPIQFTDLTNEADRWQWEFGDGGTSVEQNPLYQYGDTGTFTVRLTAINSGCRVTTEKENVVRIKPPVARFSYQGDCNSPFRILFTDESVGANTWQWDFGDGNRTNEQHPQHLYAAEGTYRVSLTVTNDTCSNTTFFEVKVFENQGSILAQPDEACRNTLFRFDVQNFDFSSISSFTWEFGDGNTQTSTRTNVYNTFSQAGNYNVRLIATDIYGCRDTVPTLTVRVNGPTARYAFSNNTGCKNLDVNFTDQSVSDGRNNITAWIWDFGNGQTETLTAGGSTRHRYDTAGIFGVKLKVLDAAGCRDSMTINNLVTTTNPQADFTISDTLSCPGAPLQFNNRSSSSVDYTSFWDFGNGQLTSERSPAYNYPDTGLYTIRLRIRDYYGCEDTMIRTNAILVSRPRAHITLSDSVSSCAPFEVTFTNSSQFYRRWMWEIGRGGISTQVNPIRYFNTPGEYPVSLTVTSAGGCTDTFRTRVRLYDTTGTRIRYAAINGCKPVNLTLEASSPGPVSFTWDFGDGVLVTGPDSTISHTYNSFGDFVPKVIMTDPAGCVFAVPGPDTLHVRGANVNFGLDRNLLCDLGPVSFIDSTTFNDPVTEYSWDFGDGQTSAEQQPVHQYTGPGLYTVSLRVRTSEGCADTLRKPAVVKVVSSPAISLSGDEAICINDFAQHAGGFTRTDTSQVRWLWQFPNGATDTLQRPRRQQYRATGDFQVAALAVNSSGCADTAYLPLRVNPLPEVQMPPTLTVQVGFPLQVPATYSANTASYAWSPAAGLSCTDCPQPMAGPKFNTQYTVNFTDSNGCRNTASLQVIVICQNGNVFVPNTFSPNGDGSNDVFYVRGRGLERVKTLRIFNRWGEIVFEQNNFPVNNPAYGWDGRYKGGKAQPDVYIYQVEVFCENSEIIRFEGNIALIQ